jgi:hypothetical protein
MRTAQLAYKSNMRNDDGITCAVLSARRPDLQSKRDLSVSSAMVALVTILSIRASPPYPSQRSKSGFPRNGTGPTLADCSVSFPRRGGVRRSAASLGVLGSSAHRRQVKPRVPPPIEAGCADFDRLLEWSKPAQTRSPVGEGWGGRSSRGALMRRLSRPPPPPHPPHKGNKREGRAFASSSSLNSTLCALRRQ